MQIVDRIVAERSRLASLLDGFDGLEVVPSEANFMLVRVLDRRAGDLAAALRAAGVLVRYYDRPELCDYIRVSVGRPQDTDRLVEVLGDLEVA